MAYTKAPTTDTHNVVRIPVEQAALLTSSTSTTNNVPVTSWFINCFVLKEEQWGTEPIRALHKREGYTSTVLTGTVTNTGFRSACIVPTYQSFLQYIAKNTTIYAVNYFTNTVTATLTGNSTVCLGWGTNFIDSTNARRIGWLESYTGGGTNLYAFLEDGTSQTTTSLTALTANGNAGLVFIDGYLFAVSNDGRKIYNSNAAGAYTTWTSTDFLDAEQYADPITWIAKHKNYLVAFGNSSIEFFFNNAIEVGSPLARQESYSTRIGLVTPQASGTYWGQKTVNVEDDIYFLGKSAANTISLYRIRDFQVKEIQSSYIQGALNFPASTVYYGIDVMTINNNPSIIVRAPSNYVYNINEDSWWTMAGDDTQTQLNGIGSCFVPVNTVAGVPLLGHFLTNEPTATSVYLWKPDQTYVVNVDSDYYTNVIDLGTNRWKNLARVDAIGDYGNNTVNLFYNPTPNYDATFYTLTATGQTPSTIGYGSNISWYNLGASRRFILQMSMDGTGPGIHRGLELEYNIGVA